jgi:hypothetical protein
VLGGGFGLPGGEHDPDRRGAAEGRARDGQDLPFRLAGAVQAADRDPRHRRSSSSLKSPGRRR